MLKQLSLNALGWRTKQRIVVLESDDWGAIRTSNNKALVALKRLNVRVDDCHYTKYDALASAEDLEALLEVLDKVQNRDGKAPVLTANTIVANPDFKRIKDSNYTDYFWENFKTSLQNYPEHGSSFSLWQEGMDSGLLHPQFHGREHLNISRWMVALQNGDKVTRKAFDIGICGLSGHIVPQTRGTHLAAFDGGANEIRYNRAEIVREGLQIFTKIFGYSSMSMIAPNYVWDDEIEEAAREEGVKYIQGSTAQRLSKDYNDKQQIKRHYIGQTNKLGQHYLMRNCHFEPSSNPDKDWVNSCLSEIQAAFTMRKPAIISTHRVNYIGFIDPQNRDSNLPKLEFLLKQIVKKWPDVNFMSSDQLGNYLTNQNIK
jgi:hypothetical protein